MSKATSQQRYSPDEVIAAIVAARGIVVQAAAQLGCNEGTIRSYAARYKTVAAALNDAREAGIDYCESKLFEQIEAGNLQAIMFYLRTMGKHRGYTERMEVAGVEQQPITVNIRRVDARQPEPTIPLEQSPEYKAALRTLVA